MELQTTPRFVRFVARCNEADWQSVCCHVTRLEFLALLPTNGLSLAGSSVTGLDAFFFLDEQIPAEDLERVDVLVLRPKLQRQYCRE